MKRFTYCALAATAALLAACGTKGGERTGGTDEPLPTDSIMPSTSDLALTDTLRLGGHTYVVSLDRHTDTALPTVRDANGTEFFDNRVDVRAYRDGEPVIDKTFTKGDFDSYLSEADRRESVLQGMAIVREECTAQRLRLVAQVGEPGADGEGPAFSVSLNPTSGEATIVRDLSQDTPRDDMMGDDEEGN